MALILTSNPKEYIEVSFGDKKMAFWITREKERSKIYIIADKEVIIERKLKNSVIKK